MTFQPNASSIEAGELDPALAARIPVALPVPVVEGGTGAITAGAALAALGGEATGTAAALLGTATALTTFYADATAGSDTTGTGAVGAPWATLAKALSAVRYLRATGVEGYIVINLVGADGTDGVDAQITYTWPDAEQDHRNI